MRSPAEVSPRASSADGRRTRALGDGALLLDWPSATDSEANRKARSIAEHLEQSSPQGFQDCVVGARSLLLVFDPLRFDPGAALRMARFWESDFASLALPALHEIPVCYGSTAGIDLEQIAAEKGMGGAEFVRIHSGAEYRVAFLGFTPGFGYLTGLPEALASQRLATPRLSVPWGSVAIGGSYTGIYPSTTPGGWRLIGRTPISLFDPSRDSPARLSPGDRVKFVPIEQWRFAAMTGGGVRP
ncbi:MAG: 5-oxoprolinase subunit PxpB [Thermoanaerobaculia bacterium]